MQPSLRLLYRLYYGKARRIVRAVLRRFLQQRRRVFLGPLRGWVCEGNLENVLGIYELHVQQVFHTTLMQGDVVYDVGGADNVIYRIDPKTDTLVATLDIVDPCFPNGLSINPSTNQAVVGCSSRGDSFSAPGSV